MRFVSITTITFTAPTTFTGSFELDSATLNGPATVVVEGAATWVRGTIAGPGVIDFDGGLNIAGNFTRTLSGRTLNNAGPADFAIGLLLLNDGAIFNNLSGATFTASNPAGGGNGISSDAGAPGVFNNAGTFTKSAGANQFRFTNGVSFINTGTVRVTAGELVFGTSFLQTAGVTDLDGGNLSNVTGSGVGGPFTFDGGRLVGTGEIIAGASGNFSAVINNQATVAPGHSGPGRIVITGNYTQANCGALEIEIAGLATAGTDFDQLSVSHVAELGGVLRVSNINGFTPNPSDSVVALTYGSHTGNFSQTNSQVNYGSTSAIVAALPTKTTAPLLNISTRLRVLTDDQVLIGGFIITGTEPKKVLIRAIGPSLENAGVAGALADPVLQLFQGQTVLASNDNWKDSQRNEIEASTIPPTDDREAAIVRTMAPGDYTAIVSGSGGSTGVGLVEAYDLERCANSLLANISTRGFVDTADNVMIGGFIVGGEGASNARVVVRGIGPSLEGAGVPNTLQDPTLGLHNANGTAIQTNDNWEQTQKQELLDTGIAPADPRESALVATLAPGNYTAIVRGAGDTIGVGLVEVYNIQ